MFLNFFTTFLNEKLLASWLLRGFIPRLCYPTNSWIYQSSVIETIKRDPLRHRTVMQKQLQHAPIRSSWFQEFFAFLSFSFLFLFYDRGVRASFCPSPIILRETCHFPPSAGVTLSIQDRKSGNNHLVFFVSTEFSTWDLRVHNHFIDH